MSIPAMTSRLEVVNAMLRSIGEAPINTLDGQRTVDSAMAEALLSEVAREIQVRGWHFNTEDGEEFTPDSSGKITLPVNAVHVEASERTSDLVARGTRLFDRANKTFTFTGPVKLDVVYVLDWDDLPETARRFIRARCCRIFAEQSQGDQTVLRGLAADEARAERDLEAIDLDRENTNIFHNTVAFEALDRVSPLDYI